MSYEMIRESFNTKKATRAATAEHLTLLNVSACWFNFFTGTFIKLVIKLSGVVYGRKSMASSKTGSYLF